MVKEESGSVRGCGSSLGRCKVNHFEEGIHKDNDSIKPSSSARQLGNEVHRDLFPRVLRDGQWL